MTNYMMVVRHEPDTRSESGCGWWYTHHDFEETTDAEAIKTAHRIAGEIGSECSIQSNRHLGYGCDHSVDKLYRVEDFKHVSIYDDGVYQSISWDKNGNTVKVKRVTDGALRALLRNPFWSTG